MSKLVEKIISAVIDGLGKSIGKFLLDVAAFAKDGVQLLKQLADKKEKKEAAREEAKDEKEIQDICNNGSLDDLLKKFNKSAVILACLALAGCATVHEPKIVVTNSWEGHFKDEKSFYQATREVHLEKDESIWVLSNSTLSQLLINARKDKRESK